MSSDHLSRLLNRTYTSFHWIFVRCAGQLTESALLEQLSIRADPVEPVEHLMRPCVAVGRCGEWVCLADGGSYTLWNSRQTTPCLKRLATSWDVLQHFVADCDNSHAIQYFQGGQRVRDWLVIEDADGGYITHTTFGDPLPGEESPLTLT